MIIDTLSGYIITLIKFIIIILLAGLIGYERERIHRPAGLRTHIIVGIGSLMLTIISIDSFPADLSRVIAGIVTGLGFLGAGTIFREHDVVKGLTTAASIWATAGVAMALALNEYFIAILGAVSIYVILEMKNYNIFKPLFPEEFEEQQERDDYVDSFWMQGKNISGGKKKEKKARTSAQSKKNPIKRSAARK